MSNPTSNFGWQMPQPTDLVTDLPADFEVFGQAVDTSLADLKGGSTGQVLSKNSNTDMDFVWVTSDDANAIQNTIVDAKGDLIAATAADTPARLAVGTNGQVLTADSTAATGLKWTTPSGGSNTFYAGKNKIINGDFGIWQRGTSIPTNGYNSDRWQSTSDASVTISRQTFTPGTAPVAGYEGIYFCRIGKSAGGSFTTQRQAIENVQTFAGQTIVLSFWAKASTAINLDPYYEQIFGSGGSGTVGGAIGSSTAITTSWARYSFSVTLPSIAGKTIGANNCLMIYAGRYIGAAAVDIDIWGVQVEAGSTATDFVTASGNSPQGELAMCQRYYYRLTATQSYSDFGTGYNPNTTNASYMIPFPVSMRTTPTAMETTGTASDYNVLHQSGGSPARTVCSAVPSYQVATPTNCRVYFSVSSGLTAGNGSVGGSNNNTTAYLGWSAEL